MFRDMRRIKQVLSQEENIKILERNTAGVLAVTGDDGYPYAVPISYVYADGQIYLHSAKTGHKIDGIMRNRKISFCVVDQDQVVPEEYTTYFRSVILFGTAELIAEETEKRRMLEKIAIKYEKVHNIKEREQEINGSIENVCMIKIMIEHMTGKEAIELVRKKQFIKK